MGHHYMPSPYRYDAQDQLRVITPVFTFPDVVDAAFNQIREYGRSSTAVTIRLLGIFGTASWSGGGVSSLNKFAEKIKWQQVGESVEAKSSPKDKDFQKCIEIADEMAELLIKERV
jgi:uncharacterized membrane protein